MPQSEICVIHVGERLVPRTIDEALDKRSQGTVEDWRCVVCDGAVSPHVAGGNESAHFEHDTWDKECPLCHPAWREERLAYEVLEHGGLSHEEAKAKVKSFKEEARLRGTSFGVLSKRAQAPLMKRTTFIDRFAGDLDALIHEIERREQQA